MRTTDFIAQRPLVGLAVFLVAGNTLGLATGRWQDAACGWLAVAGLWLAARRIAQLRRLTGFATLLAAFATGWLGAAMSTDRRNLEVEWLAREAAGSRATVYGIVDSDLTFFETRTGAGACRFALRDVTVRGHDGVFHPNATPLRVTWYGVSPRFGARWYLPATGERWQFDGALFVSRGGLWPDHATLRTHTRSAQRLASASLRDWRTLTERTRQTLAERLTRGIQDWGNAPALVQAIFLGMRRDIPPELQAVFRDSGIVYAFAIAGLHVAIVAVFVVGLLSFLGVPRTWWCVPLAPVMLFYTAATGMSASALRACLMATLYFGAPLIGRRPDSLTTLAAAAVIALGIDPFQLQDVGFCLSFAVMGGLFLLYPSLARIFRTWLGVDEAALERRAAEALGGELSAGARRRRQWRDRILRWLAETVAVSLTAWLSSAPLTAHFFGRLTPGSLLASLPVAPALFGVGIASCTGFLVGLVWPWGEVVLNHAAGALALGLSWVARAAAAVPGASLPIPPPPVWATAVWYAALLLLTWGLWRLTHKSDAGAAWLEKASLP